MSQVILAQGAGLIALAALWLSSLSLAQAAMSEAERVQAEDARESRAERLRQYDKPVRQDIIGNSVIGGGASTIIRGTAKGLVSAATGVGLGIVRDLANPSKD